MSSLRLHNGHKSLKELVDAKRAEIIRALSGRGQYRLKAKYSYIGIDQTEWQKKRPDQRKAIIKRLDECTLIVNEWLQCNNTPSTSDIHKESSIVYIEDGADSNNKDKELSTSYDKLEITAADSGITTLHQSVLAPMWEKANKLLKLERGIQRAASSDPNAWCVQSSSSPVPHFITSKDTGQFLCDSQCPQWVSTKICSHTLAASQVSGKLSNFLSWYTFTNQETNITSLSMLHMPSGRGRKGGVPKRKRSRLKPLEPDIVVSRPSLQASSTMSSFCHSPSIATNPCMFYNTTYPYPYLSPTPTLPVNPNPFYLKFITGNIRVCQGCKGSLRTSDNSIPPVPHDVCVARAEKRPYRDASSGNLVTPSSYKAAHYHLALACIQSVEPTFMPTSLQIPTDVYGQLSQSHKDLVMMQFALTV